MDISLSIAIVTRNRPESLKNVLISLSKQSIPNLKEILLSDDSNNEISIKKNIKLSEEYNVKYFRGPQKGLYSNRNFIATKCTGTHIRTMDDDHEFPELHFQQCINAIKSNPNSIWTIGEYNYRDKVKKLPAPIPGQLHPRGYSCTPKNMEKYHGISCGASIYPKSVIDKGILNYEFYKFGMLYLEYGARLASLNYSIKHLDTTYVIHNPAQHDPSITSINEIEGARLYSMLMFSFKYRKTFGNKIQTIYQIGKEILSHQYSPKLLLNAYQNFRKTPNSILL